MQRLSAHFTADEFACHCGRVDCDAPAMSGRFVMMLEELRGKVGGPIYVLSGTRCEYWNRKVGGADKSQHVLGNAADLRALTHDYQERLAKLADAVGFGGIGLADNFVHLDGRYRAPGKPPVRWTYPPKAR